MTGYQQHRVPVRGGELQVGSWTPQDAGEAVVLAVHGITAHHLSWPLVADELTAAGISVLAPDLRGRGRSAELPGPYGMVEHVQDLVAVLNMLAPGTRCVVAGHSMGGFVAVMLAATRPDLVRGLVLVDGGVPLVLPEGWTVPAAVEAGLGPAAARLEMTFADRAEYRRFWQEHPALGPELTPVVQDYVDYDLRPAGQRWQPSCQVAAMATDSAEQFVAGPVDLAWPAVTAPVTFLRAPRGLQNEPGGLYPRRVLDPWLARHPAVRLLEVPDVNHYTITLGPAGARAVAGAITELAALPEAEVPSSEVG